jgi:hypothetical protein
VLEFCFRVDAAFENLALAITVHLLGASRAILRKAIPANR